MARRISRPILTRTKRGLVWAGLFPSTAPTAVGTNGVILLGSLNAVALALRPFTIVRTRGFFHWNTDQLVAGEIPFGAAGLQVVTDSAAAIGITAVPTPVAETNADYFVYQGLVSEISFNSAIGFDAHAGRVFEFDSKAMRKVGTDDDVAITVENESSTSGAEITMGGRMLLKLL